MSRPILERRIRTRGYETDVTRTIPLDVVMSHLEHLRWETMLEPELGLRGQLETGHYFVVRGQVVELCTSVGQGHDLAMRAIMERSGRSSAWVRHEVVRIDDGVLVAQARVHGVWMGPDRRPARIPKQMRTFTRAHLGQLDALVSPEPAAWSSRATPVQPADSFVHQPDVRHPILGLDVEHRPDTVCAQVEDTSEAGWVHVRTVEASDIDIFGHVNAVRYVGFVHDARDRIARRDDVAPAVAELLRGRPVRIDITYYREALCADTVETHLVVLEQRPGRLALGALLCRAGHRADPLCVARLDLVQSPVPIRHRGESAPDGLPAGA